MTDIIIGFIVFIVAVYVATLARLEATKLTQSSLWMVVVNALYIAFILMTIIMLFQRFGLRPSSQSIFIIVIIIAVIIIVNSQLTDVVAFTVVALSRMYGTNNLIKAGDHLGQVMGMNMFTATLSNYHTKTHKVIPHSKLYLLGAQQI
jgi:uncharacterized membrane protein YoaK (UPF0700 family)